MKAVVHPTTRTSGSVGGAPWVMTPTGVIRVQGRKATKQELDAIVEAYKRLNKEKVHV